MAITAESLLTTFLSECSMVRLTENERRKLHNLFQTALDKPWQKVERYKPHGPSGGFQDHNGFSVRSGDRVVYILNNKEIARGVLKDALQDGDAYVDFDDGVHRECKWNHLYKETTVG